MAKDMSGFMKSFAGNLGGDLSGLGQIGGPMSGIGILQQLMGGSGAEGPDGEDNPGMKMFVGKQGPGSDVGMRRPVKGGNTFLDKFATGLSDQLFKNAMMGFMGRGLY